MNDDHRYELYSIRRECANPYAMHPVRMHRKFQTHILLDVDFSPSLEAGGIVFLLNCCFRWRRIATAPCGSEACLGAVDCSEKRWKGCCRNSGICA